MTQTQLEQEYTDSRADEITGVAAAPSAAIAPIAGARPETEKRSALMLMGERGFAPANIEQAMAFAKAVIASGLAPRDFKSPEAVLIAMQMGAEVGLAPMASLQNIAVINGRPSIYGDAMAGIVNASGLMEAYKQETIGSIGSDDWGYRVTAKRKGRADPISATFTVAHAKKAGLWGKTGPWTQYPDRMLLARAKTFALRDAFNDVLKGLTSAEEAQDIPAEPKKLRGLNDIDV